MILHISRRAYCYLVKSNLSVAVYVLSFSFLELFCAVFLVALVSVRIVGYLSSLVMTSALRLIIMYRSILNSVRISADYTICLTCLSTMLWILVLSVSHSFSISNNGSEAHMVSDRTLVAWDIVGQLALEYWYFAFVFAWSHAE